MAARYNTQAAVEKLADKIDKLDSKREEGHKELVAKIDAILERQGAHELEDQKTFSAIDKRLSVVENTRGAMKWLGATIVGALLVATVDFLFVHLPKLFAGGVK